MKNVLTFPKSTGREEATRSQTSEAELRQVLRELMGLAYLCARSSRSTDITVDPVFRDAERLAYGGERAYK